MTFKKVVFYIAVLVLLAIAAYQFTHKPVTSQIPVVTTPVVTTPIVTSTAQYSCSMGKTIAANFSDQLAAITLSDGRAFSLAQTVSADGAQYTKDNISFITKGNQAFLQENNATTFENCVVDTTTGTAVNGYKTYTDQGKTFIFTYPEAFTLAGGGIGYTENWKTNTDGTLGLVLIALNSPADYLPKTNFGDAKFTVGTSSDPKAVKGCLVDTSGQGVVKSTVVINKVPYTKFVSVDAGAGNRYETNSFRAIQNQQCYTIEYTIHYAVLENYDPSSGIKAFDQKKVHEVLDGIVKSFAFLPQ
ncbi:MAG: MliC family protein [Candidatus Paceibacterota bacterium]